MRYGHLLAGFIFVILLLVLGILILFPTSSQNNVGVSTTKKSSATSITISTSPSTTTATGFYTAPLSNQTATITYTDDGFSPSVLTVQSGTTVIFENKSGSQFWPASDPDPSHDGYPGPGSCNGNACDACAPIAGTSWSLRFDKIGSWGYHNHLNPSHTGTILVK